MPTNRSLWILFSVVAVDLIGFGIVVPILPFYAQQYGANGAILGLLLTSYAAMQFLFSSFWGKLSDRIGRRKVILLTLIGSSFSLLLLGLADSLLFLFVGRLLSGIFAANISVASAYVADVTTDENRSKGMGLIGAAFGIGFLVGPALGGFLSSHSYSTPILFASFLTVLNIIYAFFGLKEPERHQASPETVIDRTIIKTAVLADRTVLKMCLVYFVFTVSVSQLESIFAFYMKDHFFYSARQVAVLLALMALIMILIQGGLIRTLTRLLGEKKLLIAGTFLLTIAFFFLPRMATVSLLIIPLVVASIGRAFSQPSLMSLVSKKATPQMRGAVMGTFQASASLGRVVGPLAAGLLYDQWHSSPYYLAAGLMAIVLMMVLQMVQH
ncbi:MAG: MFS transporter [Deltaproteobacteria bacterium]|nr:MFS transporter [Deltaproteobacteria bacterium]